MVCRVTHFLTDSDDASGDVSREPIFTSISSPAKCSTNVFSLSKEAHAFMSSSDLS